ncbi:MAG: hypothetical protein CMF92_02535, partial [Candidatus Marinimicrobia bacterium]|nr:hypothetical protein [Candidatus Neomarinimicrobiota bacterium]
FLIYTLQTVPCPRATLFDLLLANSNERGPGIFVKILTDIYQYYLLIEFTFILLDKNYSKVIYELSSYIY